MSAISRTSREVSATLLANASEDIEKKRHKRNPFGQQYIQLLQTPLEEVRSSWSIKGACKLSRPATDHWPTCRMRKQICSLMMPKRPLTVPRQAYMSELRYDASIAKKKL